MSPGKAPEPTEPEIQAVRSHPAWVLATELDSAVLSAAEPFL